MIARKAKPPELLATEQVVAYVRRLIEAGDLRSGQRLPAERELARRIGVSRPSVRAALQSLGALGVVETRHGAGTFVAMGPPTLGSEPLRFQAALHGFTDDEMFESRRVLEVGVAGMAAERASSEDLAAIADAVTEAFASLDDPAAFLVHDITFTAPSPPRRATRSWRRSSRWCRRCSTNSGAVLPARRGSSRAPRRSTGKSIRRSAPAIGSARKRP
jgi:DNA-binding FadR family transcriptional regulator